MTKVNVTRGENTIVVTGWQLENGVQLQVEVCKQMTDDQLAELVRLTRINTQLLLKLAIKP